MDQGSVAALGYLQADVNALFDQLSVRLAAVAADFEPVRPRVNEAATSTQQELPQPRIPVHNRYEIGKVFVNDIRFTSAMQPTAPMGAALAAKREKPKPRRTLKVFALTMATVLIAVLAWAKVYHWPELQSAVALMTGATAQGKPTSVVSGVISQSIKTASTK
ncbi:hypothetical protein PQQ64_29125 [Paraburkholderia graminis]|uniref:hypothetical protein n=1 Tax=Paraburkholderia graminis TaxID=60548 RepID=UPI0038BC8BE8